MMADEAMTDASSAASTIKRLSEGGEVDDEEFGLHGQRGGDDGQTSRNSRLARKAESARQARLRHKQFVTELQQQSSSLHARIRQLEVHCTSGPGAAHVALGELKQALKPEQLSQLTQWLKQAQGEDHLLARYERGAALPPPASAAAAAALSSSRSAESAPIAIGGAGHAHWRGGMQGTSPMESEEDASVFQLSRSWDDIEGARSILNLDSPNGFHPMVGPPTMSFSLPTASLPPFPPHQSMPGTSAGTSMFRSAAGSMMGNGRQPDGAS